MARTSQIKRIVLNSRMGCALTRGPRLYVPFLAVGAGAIEIALIAAQCCRLCRT